MPKAKPEPDSWSAGQVVAHNLTRARELRRLTQTEVAERLTRFTEARWTQATVAQAEGSVAGQRVRQFTANELVALARTFDLPVLYFFLPPEDGAGGLATPDATSNGWPWEYLLMLVWGHAANFPIVADRAAPWAHVSPLLNVHADDPVAGAPDDPTLARLVGGRQRLKPEDLLAVAFNGLARRRMRGAPLPGQEVAALASNLRGLADALDAFNNDSPGAFFDAAAIRKLHGRDADDRDEPESEGS